MASRLPKKGVGGVASAAGPDARSRDEGDAGAHRGGAATPQTAPRDFRLRRSRCDRQPRDFKGPQPGPGLPGPGLDSLGRDRKSTRLNSSHITISYAVFCLKKKKK